MFNVNFRDEDYSDEKLANIQEWIEKICEEFEETEQFKALSETDQENFAFLISVFYKSCYSYCLVGPGKVDESVIDEMMLDVMLRKASADTETFESFEPIMLEFLPWCQEKEYIQNVQRMCDHIKEVAPEMIRRALNPRYWGLAKSIYFGGTPNFNFGNDYNPAGSVTQENVFPFKRNQPKIGRNSPCECGSGEKYKKCCLDSA